MVIENNESCPIPSVMYELDETAPQLKGTVTISTGEKISGEGLVRIKDKDGWYEFFETHPGSPVPWRPNSNIPIIVKVGNEWYNTNPNPGVS
jgi:hypothetical protein